MQSFCSNGEHINTRINGSVAGLSTAKQYTRVRVPAYAPQKVSLEKRKFKVLYFLLSTVKKEETTEILSWTQPQLDWIEEQNLVQTIKIV